MKRCGVCGSMQEEDALFCGHCGSALEDERTLCASCGKPLAHEARFCGYCGRERETRSVRSCPACGQALDVALRYCPSCGVEVVAAQKERDTAVDASPAPQGPDQATDALADQASAPQPPAPPRTNTADVPRSQSHAPAQTRANAAPAQPAARPRALIVRRTNQMLYLFANYQVLVNGLKVAQLVTPGEQVIIPVSGKVIHFAIECTNFMERHRKLYVRLRLGANPVVEMSLSYPGNIQINVQDAVILSDA